MKNTRFSSNNSNQFQESRISNNSEVFTQFNDQISVHNELMAWKGRFYEIERNFLTMNKDFNENKEKMAMIIRENEVLKVNSREKDEEIKRIMGELRESQKFALMFPEMNENMQRLLQENERLKSVILNRCRDLTRETWSF